MRSALLPVTALLISASLLLMGNGLQGVLLPVRALEEDYSSFDIGVLGSAYYFGFAAGCMLGAHLVRRVGHIRTFAALVAVTSALPLVHGMATWNVAWWLARAATGFCLAGLYMVIESWLNEKATNETRGLVFSAYTVLNLTVVTLGQMMLTLAPASTLFLFALASILISVSAVPVAITLASAPSPPALVRIRLKRLLAVSPVGVIGCFGVGLTNGAFWSLAPVFAQRDLTTTSDVAIFMSIAVLAGAIAQWPAGLLSDRMDRRRVIVAICLGAGIAGGALVGMSQFGDWAILTGVAAFGFFAFPLYAICAAHLNDFVEADGYVEASSALLLVFAGGAVLGPICASAIIQEIGVTGLFVWTLIVHLALAAFVLYRMQRRAPAAETERATFTESIAMAGTVVDIDLHESEAASPAAGGRTEPSPERAP